jgi:anti-sigma factor RsiW
VELVTDYFDGAMDAATREEFDLHLAACPGCVTYLKQMRTAIRLTRDLGALERRPEVPGLLEAFRDWSRAQPSPG